MARIAYVNGRWLGQRSAAVNIEDRGYQFGDGVYEVVHVHGGRFIDEGRHLARLDRSLREIKLPEPMPRAALLQVMRELVRRNRVADGLVYMQVTRGVARRDHAFPRRPVPPALVMTVKRIPPYPRDVDAWAVSAITAPDLRWARRDIKSLNLLPNVLARQAAREAGAAEAILYDEATGAVAEGAATSFWIVDEHGTLRTRPLGHAILPGCTRDALIAELAEAGIAHEEREFTLEETRRAREAFLTSATSFVKPITRLDGQPVGEGTVGPVTRRLFDLFARHVQGGPRNSA
jgi:D-alanine transaminase